MNDSSKSPTSSSPQAEQPSDHNVCAVGAAIIDALRALPCSNGPVLPSSPPRACCIGCGFVSTKLNATPQTTPDCNRPSGRTSLITETIQSLMTMTNLPCPKGDKGDFDDPIAPKSPLPPEIQQPNLVERLPSDLHDRLVEVGRASRTALGKQWSIQAVVNRDIDLIKCLRTSGASNAELVQLLYDVGVCAENGRPLPLSTLSSAISRACRPRHATAVDTSCNNSRQKLDENRITVPPPDISAIPNPTIAARPHPENRADPVPPPVLRHQIRAPPNELSKENKHQSSLSQSAALLRQLTEELP